ncbi:MAG: NAD(P)H-dependent oxidoreductase [Streptococcus sanguinis]|nr:NAD(P)H-dependent oxidoreductase [Streptococcus sanguinis]
MIYLVNASPNRNGNSFKLGHFFLRDRDYEALQLVDYHIEQYGQSAENDQFFQVYELLSQADVLVFTSPIYWWSFSGLLKTLLDRVADVHEPQEALKGKKVFFLLQGSQPSKEIEMLDYVMSRFCRNCGLKYEGLAVTNHKLKEIDGWELTSLKEKLDKVLSEG